MQVKFWGTRGSIAKPGKETARYGGNTSCVELRAADGTLVVIDCGTGAHGLGQALMAEEGGPVRGHLLISHTHWDHIQGLPFFAPLFVPGNEWDIYAPRGLRQSMRDTLAGQMQYKYFPVALEDLGATIRYHDLVEGAFQVGDMVVHAHYLNHPALTLGYRIHGDGMAVVYACDHEPYSRQLAVGDGEISGRDTDHVEFVQNADLVIHDAQYTAHEYANRIGWGHSTVGYAAAICSAANVKTLALTHHDPLRDDDSVDQIVENLRKEIAEQKGDLQIVAAAEGNVIDLGQRDAADAVIPKNAFSATAAISVSDWEHAVLLGCVDSERIDVIKEITKAESIALDVATNLEELRRAFSEKPFSLAIIDSDFSDTGIVETCRSLMGQGAGRGREAPLIAMADQHEVADTPDDCVSDWLVRPFSPQYARTRLRAWVLRTTCQWARAQIPDDEDARLKALHALDILDTPAEERFDRVTRIAAAAFDVPVTMINFVDSDRQWTKSCHGYEIDEISRDAAFCAHTILNEDSLVVSDTHLDSRFAENPFVAGAPHVRFYAGAPVEVDGGQRVGTLCLIDTRPRDLDDDKVKLLEDLAELVKKELLKEDE